MLIKHTVSVTDTTGMTHSVFVLSAKVYAELMPMISHMYIGTIKKNRKEIIHPVQGEKITKDYKPRDIETLALALWELEMRWTSKTRYTYVAVIE